MNRRHQFEFILLAAIWGASFLFMRVAAPEFGPVPLMLMRCGIGAAVLLPIAWARFGSARLVGRGREQGGRLFVAGLFNSAIPFVMFGFAALTLSAGFASILNASTPIFGALIGYVWLKERLTRWRVAGLLIGIGGVALLSWERASIREVDGVGLAVLAILVATFCYGIAGNYARKKLAGIEPLIVAAGSQVAATLVLVVPGVAQWPALPPSGAAWVSALVLGSVCTGLAYVLFFRLIAQVSASAALSVTFLIPVFGVLWGVLFLAESVDLAMIIGGALIVAGTALATGVLAAGDRLRRGARR